MSPVVLVLLGLPLLIAAGGAAWWTFRRPQRTLLVLAALLPFDGLLLIVPHPGFVEGWKEGLVLGAVAVALLTGRRRGPADAPLPAWVSPLAALVALGVASALAGLAGLGGGADGALVGLKVTFFFLLVPFVLWRCPFTATDRDRLVTILMGTAVIVSLVGIGQRVVGDEALVRLGYEYNTTIRFAGDQLRAVSTFNQPFPFAFYVVAVALVAVPIALTDRSRWRNRLFLAALPLLLLGVLASVVRAGLLAAAAGAAWLLAVHGRSLLRYALPALALGGVVLATAGAAFVSSDSLQERLDGWAAIVDEVAGSPFGDGIGTTGAAAEKAGAELTVGAAATDEDAAYQPDNYYVKLLLELGPIGTWLFAAVLVLLVADGRRIRAAALRAGRPADAAFAEGITAATIAAAVAATVSTYWEIFPVDVLFWMLQGVLLSLRIGLPALPEWSPTRSPSAPVVAACRPTSASSCAASVV